MPLSATALLSTLAFRNHIGRLWDDGNLQIQKTAFGDRLRQVVRAVADDCITNGDMQLRLPTTPRKTCKDKPLLLPRKVSC